MNKLKNILIGFSISTTASAADLHLVSLDRFAMEQYQVVHNRDEYYPYDSAPSDNEHWSQGTAVLFDVDLVKYGLFDMYYRARVHGEATNEQYREVGLQFETGFELKDYLNVFWQHHSQHGLDYQAMTTYPLQDFVGCRVTFYKRDR